MKWIGPLFTNAGGWAAYVSYQDGVWYIGHENPTIIGEGKSGMLLLPMMQEGYGENYHHQIELLRAGLKLNFQDPELAVSFPFHVPVLTAFQHMYGWVKIAADWAQYIELNMERAQILFDACQSKIIDQSSRHKVLKVVNKWAKQEGFAFVRN
jgi:hypothetical protein